MKQDESDIFFMYVISIIINAIAFIILTKDIFAGYFVLPSVIISYFFYLFTKTGKKEIHKSKCQNKR